LQSDDERKAFTVNKDEHLAPILCAEVNKLLAGGASISIASDSTKDSSVDYSEVLPDNSFPSWRNGQSPQLLALIAAELQCAEEDIADFELSLYDTQPAAISGMQAEFLCSSRLDNLASCFVAVEALVQHVQSGAAREDEDISVVALFDHEEVGSNSVTGAGSTLISDTIERVSHALSSGEAVDVETKALSASRCEQIVFWEFNCDLFDSIDPSSCRLTWRMRSTLTTPPNTRSSTRPP
jgi:aspartyl aminopeptidase